MVYSNKQYWGALHGRDGLSAVGQSALPDAINDWIYRSTRRNLRRFVKRNDLTGHGTGRMLEVGVGSGYWVDFWAGQGWHVDGCDLVPAAAEKVQQAHPEGRFWAADASSADGLFAGVDAKGADDVPPTYDLVTATNVLLHVTADDAFAQALANVAAAVRPGGHLLLVEPALTIEKKQAKFDPKKHSRARLLRSYRKPLRAHGLELVTVEAATVLAANPLEASSPRRARLYKRWWRQVVTSKKKPSRVRWIGPTMYVADGLLMHTNEAPTSKFLLFRRLE